MSSDPSDQNLPALLRTARKSPTGGHFNSKKFTHEDEAVKLNNFVDVTDAYANSGLELIFEHVPTETFINFKAYITAFNETFSSDWATETVFGRIDPIAMFKQTTRNVTLSFKVVAATPSEGFENLYRVDVLRSFLYPTYAGEGAQTLSQSPLVRVKVMNMLTNGAQSNTYNQMFSGGVMTAMQGALTVIKSMSVAHNLDNTDVGSFHVGDPGASQAGVVPKMMEISLDFMVLHEANMGWQKGADAAPGVYGTNMANTMFTEPEPEPAATQLDSDTDTDTAAQALTDTRIAKWAQTTSRNINMRRGMRSGTRELKRAGLTPETSRVISADVWADDPSIAPSTISDIAEQAEEMLGTSGFTDQSYLNVYSAD